jgi:plasmid replication initiation protein
MAMACLPPDLSELTTVFSYSEWCKALGIERGGNTQKLFEQAVDECMKSVITIYTGKGKRGWEKYTWFEYARLGDEDNEDRCTMIFSNTLATVLLEIKKMYAKIPLDDLGKLQSQYAIRHYEMAMSYSSLAGHNGNKPGAWYYERTPAEIRELMNMDPEKYKEMADFRKRIVEDPCKEINQANIGLTIAPEYKRKGRNLVGVRFNCEKTPKQVTRKRKKAADTPGTPTENPKIARLLETKEATHLKKLYPEEYAAIFQEEYAKPRPFPAITDSQWALSVEGTTLERLKATHGIRL